MPRKWLTPDGIPEGVNCWLIEVPDSIEIEAILRGCLFLLTLPWSWEKTGATTAEEAAMMGQAMLDSLTPIDCP